MNLRCTLWPQGLLSAIYQRLFFGFSESGFRVHGQIEPRRHVTLFHLRADVLLAHSVFPCATFRAPECAFAAFGAKTKHQIATAIAERFPELALRLPPIRKIWMPEDYRMSIFDAVAFAMTFFYFRGKGNSGVAARQESMTSASGASVCR